MNYVDDGWTEISAMLRPMSTKEMAAKLARRPTPEEIGYMAEIADYRAMNVLRSRVDDVVKDPATAEALKPWYRWFCKRPCFHDDYLEAFNRPNVRLVDTQGRGRAAGGVAARAVDGRGRRVCRCDQVIAQEQGAGRVLRIVHARLLQRRGQGDPQRGAVCRRPLRRWTDAVL